MNRFKTILIWIKNLLTPLTIKAAIALLERKGYIVAKHEDL